MDRAALQVCGPLDLQGERMSGIDVPSYCKECGGLKLTWFTNIENRSGVQEGRLRTQEVSCVFVLGCDNCSETLKVVSADKIAEMLNKTERFSP